MTSSGNFNPSFWEVLQLKILPLAGNENVHSSWFQEWRNPNNRKRSSMWVWGAGDLGVQWCLHEGDGGRPSLTPLCSHHGTMMRWLWQSHVSLPGSLNRGTRETSCSVTCLFPKDWRSLSQRLPTITPSADFPLQLIGWNCIKWSTPSQSPARGMGRLYTIQAHLRPAMKLAPLEATGWVGRHGYLNKTRIR